jgi:Fic family protein
MNSFSHRFTGLPAGIWQHIAQIDESKGRWHGGSDLGTQALGRLRRSVLATSTGASTRIEGARLSDEDVERLMRGASVHQLADRDAQEVRGYYEVLQLIFESYAGMPLSENIIKQLHGSLLVHTAKDQRHRGAYKTQDNSVDMTDQHGQVVGTLFETTPAYLTAKQMDELVTWTNQALVEAVHHPLLVIGNFVVEFLKIHPFLDGNGRLSRVLTTLLLLRAGYGYVPYVSLEQLIEAQKTEYYLALRRSQTTFGTAGETIEPWLAFFVAICQRQAAQATDLLTIENVEVQLSPSQRLVWNYLDTVSDVPPGAISRATGVPLPTVAQTLDKLRRLGVVERLGLGRATRYRKTLAELDRDRPEQEEAA